jgi:molecular chaperone IbpA
MVHTFGLDLFNDPFFIGFNHTLQRLNHVHTANPNNYPPYNVVKKDNETWVVEMAVAGFSRDQITVTEQDGTLVLANSREPLHLVSMHL